MLLLLLRFVAVAVAVAVIEHIEPVWFSRISFPRESVPRIKLGVPRRCAEYMMIDKAKNNNGRLGLPSVKELDREWCTE